MTLQEIVTDYLVRNQLTQRQFTKKCGDVSHGYIHMLIKGPNPRTGRPCVPRRDTLEAIARGMGCTAKDLIDRADDLSEELINSPQKFVPEGQISMGEQFLKGNAAPEQKEKKNPQPPKPDEKPESEDEQLIRRLAGRIRSSVKVDGEDQKRLDALRRSVKLRTLFDAQMKMSESDLDYMLQFAKGILMNKK